MTPPAISDRDQMAYAAWCADGGAAGMNYMVRDPRKRSRPAAAFPEAKSVLTLAVSYCQGPFPEKPAPSFGRVARYAWGLDYHAVILDRLNVLLARIKDVMGNPSGAALAVDTKPLLERALAAQAGLGFVGKNTMLIVPRSSRIQFHVGSWIFLAEVLLDVPIDTPHPTLPHKGGGKSMSLSLQGEGVELPSSTGEGGCGACTKCLTACPTGAFEGPYQLRAQKCISYLTIENKGWIPREMRAQIGDWIFGCDVCQEVCPFNARAREARWPEFKPDRGAGAWVSLKEILETADEASFKKKWGHTPLSRPKRRGLVRNACVVAGNACDESLVPILKSLLKDPEPIVRGHALWALGRLMSQAQARGVAGDVFKREENNHVREECEAILDC